MSVLLLGADPSRVESVVEELENGAGAGRQFEILEEDLNAYLAVELKKSEHPAVQDVAVRFHEGSFTTRLKVDMDKVEVKDQSMTAGLLASLMTGVQIIQVEGTLKTNKGTGTYVTRKAWLNDVPVPATLVDSLLSRIGRKNEPPFDPTEPFKMPYEIKEVIFKSGRVQLFT